MLLLYAIAAGLTVGLLRGGRVRNLEFVHITWWPLALIGLLVQMILFAAPVAEVIGSIGPWLYVASSGLVFAALLRNVRVAGAPFIALGATLNLTAIVANGGYMPSSPEAWLALSGSADLPVTYYTNVALIGPATVLPFLGDVFVLPSFVPMATPFSVGDMCIAVGAVVLLARAMGDPRTAMPDPRTTEGPDRAPSAGRSVVSRRTSRGAGPTVARP